MQEALTNVRRHAGEASVVVRVLVTATALEIEVADDGMVQSLEGHDPGYGLAGMRERATLYGGRIDAGPRNDPPGWRVHATFPLEPATGPA